ncbi:unnamed protein product [Rhodiola kirilowii]
MDTTCDLARFISWFHMMVRTGSDDCPPWLMILIRCDMARLGPHFDMMVRIGSDGCPPWIVRSIDR